MPAPNDIAPGDYLCKACERAGEKTEIARGIGPCARCPRRTGRRLAGAVDVARVFPVPPAPLPTRVSGRPARWGR